MAARGEKLGGDLRIGQPVCWGYSRESLFLGSSGIHPTLLGQRERLPRTGTARWKRMPSIHGLAWEACVSCWSDFPLQGVHRFKSLQLSDMSNRLSCGYHRVIIYWINDDLMELHYLILVWQLLYDLVQVYFAYSLIILPACLKWWT
jgi:hypothetical protein